MIVGIVGERTGPETRVVRSNGATARLHTRAEQRGGLAEQRGHLHRSSSFGGRTKLLHALFTCRRARRESPTTTSPFKNSPDSVIGSTNVSEKSIGCYRPVFLRKPSSGGTHCRCLRRRRSFFDAGRRRFLHWRCLLNVHTTRKNYINLNPLRTGRWPVAKRSLPTRTKNSAIKRPQLKKAPANRPHCITPPLRKHILSSVSVVKPKQTRRKRNKIQIER